MTTVACYNFDTDISYPIDDAGAHPGTEWDGLFTRCKLNDAASPLVNDGDFPLGDPVGYNVTYENTGKIDKCMGFNGSSSYVDLFPGGYTYVRNLSFCAWVYATSTGTRYILDGYQSSSYQTRISITGTTDIQSVIIKQYNSTATITLDPPIPYNTWFHLVAVIDYTQDNDLLRYAYINKEKQKSISTVVSGGTTYPYVQWVSGKTVLGKLYPSSSYFAGYLEDVRIYKKVITQAEVDEIYNGGAGTYTRAAYFNSRIITPYGKGWNSPGGGRPAFYIPSHTDFDFDKDMTIEVTLTPEINGFIKSYVIDRVPVTGTFVRHFLIYASGAHGSAVWAAQISDGTTTIQVTSAVLVQAGKPRDLALTWDVSERLLRLYMDGACIAQATNPTFNPALLTGTSAPITIGGVNLASFPNAGQIHRVRFSDVVKTSHELLLASRGDNPVEAPWL